MQIFNVILHPIVTEKSTKGADKGKYWFFVNKKSNKKEIADAVKLIYGVKPKKVNIMKTTEKKRVIGRGRFFTKRRKGMKAVVTLEKGKSLDQTKIKLKK